VCESQIGEVGEVVAWVAENRVEAKKGLDIDIGEEIDKVGEVGDVGVAGGKAVCGDEGEERDPVFGIKPGFVTTTVPRVRALSFPFMLPLRLAFSPDLLVSRPLSFSPQPLKPSILSLPLSILGGSNI
jgi:hypothetical protein